MINLQKLAFLTLSIFLISNISHSKTLENKCYSNLSEVMKCFVQNDDNVFKYQLHNQDQTENLTINTYILDAHKWPIELDEHIQSTVWRHKLIIYIPRVVKHDKAIFYVSGGYNTNLEGKEIFSPSKEILNFTNISINNNAVVVVLEDVPNQYLFIDSVPKKEDQILAFTYKKVMEDPMKNAYLAGHLPMVKSIVKGMDAAQEILSKQEITINNFMLLGASKRGWAAWLAALEDDRVSALMPIVIDILDVQKNINHICNSYKKHCPPALRDYQAEGIIDLIDSDAFKSLMQIEDPFNYLNLLEYAKQASIPKYVINASGDDFYSPDSSKFYFKNLMGDNYIRYLPAAMHYFAGNPISDALNNIKLLNEAIENYFYFFLNQVSLPKVSWNFSPGQISLNSSIRPNKIELWTASNDQERDFRFLNSYSKFHLGIKTLWSYLSKYLPFSIDLCDTCYKAQNIPFNCFADHSCNLIVDLPNHKKGWQASFLELHYDIENRDFVITTEIYITPDTYP